MLGLARRPSLLNLEFFATYYYYCRTVNVQLQVANIVRMQPVDHLYPAVV